MKAEDFRTFKHVPVYSGMELESKWNLGKDWNQGNYALVKLGNILSCQAKCFPDKGIAGKLVSAWNSMYRNQWGNRATKENISLKDLPISDEVRTVLRKVYNGQITKKDINESDDLKNAVLSAQYINDYVVALYYQAQVYKNPIERFMKSFEAVLENNKLALNLIDIYASHKPMEQLQVFFNVSYFDTDNTKGKTLEQRENMLRVPVMVRTINEESKATRMIPVVACKWVDIAPLYAAATKRQEQSSNSATTSAGCFRHIYKFDQATEICWFE